MEMKNVNYLIEQKGRNFGHRVVFTQYRVGTFDIKHVSQGNFFVILPICLFSENGIYKMPILPKNDNIME